MPRTTLRGLAAVLVLTPAFAAAPALIPRSSDTPDRVTLNDNLQPAGRLDGGTLKLDLEIRPGAWHLLGSDKAAGYVLAFAEADGPPSIPGPMVRIPLGTHVRARVTNRSTMTLVVRGLSSRRGAVMDTLLLGPGASGDALFTADTEGSFFYWAGAPGVAIDDRLYEDSQLSGVLIVDPPGVRPDPDDRVLMLGIWFDGKLQNGDPDGTREFFVINGRPWPNTERLSYQLGDTVRWRLINASSGVHPMHLHGFYYRVEARGDIARDTAYWPGQQRTVVTERLDPGTTMSMTFVPDRPGGWIFHCHLNWHVISNPRLGDERLSSADREHEMRVGHASHDPHNHLLAGMGGLLLAFDVKPPPDWQSSETGRRRVRLFVQSSTPAGDTLERFSFVVQEGAAEPASDSIRVPGSTLVLRRGEPTSVWVINRSSEPTQVHWHGLEIESPFDGVVGLGGFPGARPPAIMPGDSFEVRVTPPRSGSFMYHTHFNEIRQMSRGLWAPLVVLEPDESWDPTRDLVFIAGEGPQFQAVLNGVRGTLDTLLLTARTAYRVRLMNVTMGAPFAEYWLVSGGSPLFWFPRARDGHDLPAWQRTGRRAHQAVGIGETWDFQVRFGNPGDYALELRTRGGTVMARQPLRVQAPLAGQ